MAGSLFQRSRTPRASTRWRYLVAVLSVATGLLLRLLIQQILGETAPFVTFFPAVIFATWFGGIGPAIVAIVLSVVTVAYFVVSQPFELSLRTEADWLRFVIFILASVFVGALVEAMRNARQQAERARDLLHTTVSSIGDAIITTDSSGRITFLNSIAEELTGWPLADAVHRPSSEVFVIETEHTGLSGEDPIAKAIANRAVISLTNHTVLLNRSGRKIPIEDTAAPIMNADKELFGVVLVFRDVTARQQSDRMIQQSEERLQLVLAAGRIGAWDWSIPQNRIEWSDQVYDIHRIDRTSFSGLVEDYAQLIHPDDRERVQQAIDAALHQRQPYDLTFRIVRPSREVRWVTAAGRVLRNDKGEPIRMLGSVIDVTREKQAEAKLQQQWTTFDTALSNTPNHHFILDRHARFTYANRALLKLWNRDLDDIVGKDCFELEYPPELAARILQQAQDVVITRRPVRDQTAFTPPEGETRIWEYDLVPTFDVDGEVEAIAGTSHDITKRITDEQATRESEARINVALEAGGGVGTWDWDLGSNLCYANSPFAALYEVDPEIAAKGASRDVFSGRIHPHDQEHVNAAIRVAIDSGEPFAEEYRLMRSDGMRWILAKGRCQGGHFRGVVFDVTDRKRADQLLNQSQERLRAIYDGTYELIGLIAADGTLLEANRASLEFAGSTRDDLVGRKFWDTPWFAFTAGAPEAAKDGVARAAQGEFIRFEALINSPSGARRFFDISFYPIRNEQGEVILIVPEGRDITDLKRVEEQLREANAQLTRVNCDLEEFAFVASHDLQEPLRTVNLYTQLLLRDSESGNPKLDRYAAAIQQAVLHMGVLLKDLLSFSQTVHSGSESRAGVAELTEALEEAQSVLKSRIEECGASVIRACELPRVLGETRHLALVFQNLISNALKYRNKGEAPRVVITAELRDDCWIVTVQDNGIGFDPDQAERIFGLFKRLHRDEYEGTGLGLAICRRIVERYHGRIWATSAPGQGSTFHIALRQPSGPTPTANP